MKRSPGLWLLLSAGVLWISIQNVYGLRATALIFNRTSTTTTTTEPPVVSEDEANNETATEVEETTNSTKLTGNPQIDYLLDPNLPRELNGYNLSNYPFYNGMPEDIDFKCDGLHDGFYASIPHKCQVYHHCLFGTRYDFLCANYTAFDQKTFICHFVSEVDCNNSKKFWHRNDALYEAATTTTVKPSTVHTTAAPVTTAPRRSQGGGRRRPLPRRRPQYEYYDDAEYDAEEDDYYEEPPARPKGRRRQRPRPRPRPVYDDAYEEYEDDRVDRRSSGRRPYDRRESDDRRYSDRRPAERKRNKDDRRKQYDDDEEVDEEPRRDRGKQSDNPKKSPSDDERRNSGDQRPSNDRKSSDDRKFGSDDRRYEKRRPSDDPRPADDGNNKKNNERPNKTQRRPVDDDLSDEDSPQDDRRSYERPREDASDTQPREGNKPLIKPTSGSSIYDQPRKAPRIRPPVPKNEQNKYAYKPTAAKSPAKEAADEEYYDDYEEDVPSRRPPAKTNRKPEPDVSESRRPSYKSPDSERDDRRDNRRPLAAASRPRGQTSRRPAADFDEEYVEEKLKPIPARTNKPSRYDSNDRGTTVNRKRPSSPETPSANDYEDEIEAYSEKNDKPTPSLSPKFIPKEPRNRSEQKIQTTSSTTTKEPPRERPEPIVRVVKRPFLPSRGGNPYSARGLQPVGSKAIENNKKLDAETESSSSPEAPRTTENKNSENQYHFHVQDKNKPDDRKPIVEDNPKTSTGEGRVVDHRQNYKTHLIINSDENLSAKSKNTPPLEQQPKSDDKPELNSKPSIGTDRKEEVSTTLQEKQPFKPSPILIKIPRPKYALTNGNVNNEEQFRPILNRPEAPIRQNFKIRNNYNTEPRTTQKPNVPERNPLDIDETEYDVTLNDALNPTLPNLPVRSFPTGFSSSNDYTYSSYRPRYVIDSVNQASTDYAYQIRSPSQRTDTAQQTYATSGTQHYLNDNYNTQYPTANGNVYRNQNYRQNPQITQAQTQAFYSSF